MWNVFPDGFIFLDLSWDYLMLSRRTDRSTHHFQTRNMDSQRPQFIRQTPHQVNLVFFDIETTGGNASSGEIIEVAAVRYHHGREVKRFHSLVNPQVHIPKIVQSITGITNEMVKGEPTFNEIAEEFSAFIENSILCSHGAVSDYSFVKTAIKKHLNKEIKNYYICTHLLVSNFLQNIPSKTLSGVASYFDLANFKSHRALADAEITAEVFWKIYDVFEKNGLILVEDLLKVQADNETLRRLGSGLNIQDIEKIPTTPGVFYFFNDHHELSYISASGNPKKSILGFSTLGEDREINRLIVESSEFKVERSSHLLAALIKESQELKRLKLPIDPRRVDVRSNGIIQLLVSTEVSDVLLSHRVKLEPIFPNLHELFCFLEDSLRKKYDHILLHDLDKKVPIAAPMSIDSKYIKLDQDTFSKKIKLRRAKRLLPGVRATKHSLKRNAFNGTTFLRSGHLVEGIGWWVGPICPSRMAKRFAEELNTLFPIDVTNEYSLCVALSSLHSILNGQVEAQIKFLRNLLISPKNLLNLKLVKPALSALGGLEGYLESEFSRIQIPKPSKGLAVISNNDTKQLDAYVVVNGHIRKTLRVPMDESTKFKSSRFFTRMFHSFHEELNQNMSLCRFNQDVCDGIELFLHWLHSRGGEGKWVNFNELQPLYDPEVLN